MVTKRVLGSSLNRGYPYATSYYRTISYSASFRPQNGWEAISGNNLNWTVNNLKP
ncbi:hypothetical protein [Dysgonomonas mossii]|uniref:hypothetical protein n=1 Tax=Dysgonomonas mossii TaxID=163665 RepID=UPI0002D4CA07|nr:hypothetical protein [Dysgonomonas mossii]